MGAPEEETNLTTWSSQSTKLLISLRKENDSLFTKGKVRKNVAWQRVAAQFNATSSVKVTGEQCSNKWKKLEEKFKKTKEQNNKTGNNRKECDFQDELSEFFGDNPKIIPLATVASLPADGNSTDEDGEDLQAESSSDPAPSKPKKKKRRSKSSASEMIDILVEFKEEKRKEEEKKVAIIERMHADKMGIMARYLDILSRK